MAKQSTALALVQKARSNSVTFIAPLRNTLTPTQRTRAIKLLSPILPPNWLGSWKPRRYGKGWGVPNWCPKCGKSLKEICEEDRREYSLLTPGQRRTYMFGHATLGH